MIAPCVYILCTATCLACAVLLRRGFRRTQLPLLFWSGWCFGILALANALLFLDLAVYQEVNLLTLRSTVTLMAVLVMLYGLVFESQ